MLSSLHLDDSRISAWRHPFGQRKYYSDSLCTDSFPHYEQVNVFCLPAAIVTARAEDARIGVEPKVNCERIFTIWDDKILRWRSCGPGKNACGFGSLKERINSNICWRRLRRDTTSEHIFLHTTFCVSNGWEQGDNNEQHD